MILQIFKWSVNLKELWFKHQLKRAIKEADRESMLFKRKYLVIVFAGKPKVFRKSALKELIKRRAMFKKGVTV
jgi:hypothetical protein